MLCPSYCITIGGTQGMVVPLLGIWVKVMIAQSFCCKVTLFFSFDKQVICEVLTIYVFKADFGCFIHVSKKLWEGSR